MRRPASAAGLGERAGRQQRAATLREAAPTVPSAHEESGSEHVTYLLEQWAWGHLSAPAVQRHASKAYADQLALLRRVGVSPDIACPASKT